MSHSFKVKIKCVHSIKKRLPMQTQAYTKVAIIAYSILIWGLATAAPISEVNDQYYSEQWGHENIGQTIDREIDTTTTEHVSGQRGVDIGIKNIRPRLPSLMTRDVIIAVLDSGLDLDHEDIKDNIFRNTIECDTNGRPKPRPQKDLDNNGFKGDCMGWDFTRKKNNHRPYDDIGHGTHLAGIMAAVTGNSIGIAGMSNRIKILPVKVISKKSKHKNGSTKITDIFAQGIRYATIMKADVINISLGWLPIMDTENIRAAVAEAIDAGIIIVAASGNASSRESFFPCTYKGVICVSSVSNDGSISPFSNFGGNVDLLAPGEAILSLYPMRVHSRRFSLDGYEIKNGSSQAAPFVAGSASILKSIFPNADNDEILARLINGTSPVQQGSKRTLDGYINLDHSINKPLPSIIRPQFKGLNYVTVANNESFSFQLGIKNLHTPSDDIEVEISGSNSINLDKHLYTIRSMKKGEEQNIIINGSVTDIQQDSAVMLTVQISINGRRHGVFKKQIFLVRKVDPTKRKLSFPITDTQGKSIQVPNERIKTLPIRTVFDKLNLLDKSLYFMPGATKIRGQGIAISLIRKEFSAPLGREAMIRLTKKIIIPNAKQVISITAEDLNFDGKPDLFIKSITKKDDTSFITYSFFSANGTPLYGEFSHWDYRPKNGVTLNIDYSLINYNHPKLGRIAVPIFTTIGTIPEIEDDQDPWSNVPDRATNHVYFFEPHLSEDGQVTIEPRVIDHRIFRKNIRSRLNVDWNDFITVEFALPQTHTERRLGIAKFIVSIGREFSNKYYVLRLDLANSERAQTQLSKFDSNNTYLKSNVARSLINIQPNKVKTRAGSTLFKYDDSTTIAQLVYPKNSSAAALEFRHQQQAPRDFLLKFISLFQHNGIFTGFYKGKYSISMTIVSEAGETISTDSKLNSNYVFLDKQVFNDRVYPVVYGTGSSKIPAAYIDHTDIADDILFLYTSNKKGEMIRPISTSIRIPNECTSLNHAVLGTSDDYFFSLLCKGEKGWNIVQIPMK